VNFSPGSPSIQSSALSSRAAVGYEKPVLQLDREEKAAEPESLYFWAVRQDVILLLYAYPKNVAADLTPKQVSQLAKAVKKEFGSEKTDV